MCLLIRDCLLVCLFAIRASRFGFAYLANVMRACSIGFLNRCNKRSAERARGDLEKAVFGKTLFASREHAAFQARAAVYIAYHTYICLYTYTYIHIHI